jgi:hypothetical protein
MVRSTNPPLAEYLFKLCLLEAVKCKVRDDPEGLAWVESLMSSMMHRWEELNKK